MGAAVEGDPVACGCPGRQSVSRVRLPIDVGEGDGWYRAFEEGADLLPFVAGSDLEDEQPIGCGVFEVREDGGVVAAVGLDETCT